MGSTFSGLSIAISGLYANKRSLDTTSHNISNANNTHYVRQQAMHATSRYVQMPGSGMQLGTGVNIQEIRQIRDEFLDLKYREHAKELGYWSAKNSTFEEIQGIVNEMSNNGLQKVMDQFWDGWNELSKSENADNLTVRGLLKERAVAFTETVNHISQQLDSLQKNLNVEIVNKVNEVNNIGKQIANLNGKILDVEIKGLKANDYRDERNNLLDRLSQLVAVEYFEDNTGVVNVSIGGKNLVSSRYSNELAAKEKDLTSVDIYWKDTMNYPVPEKVNIKGGEIKGLLDSKDYITTKVKADLDIFVNTVAKEINKIHQQGYNLADGTTGYNFFGEDGIDPDKINASNIKINSLLNDLNYISASESGNRGDGNIARDILKLRKEYIFEKDPVSGDFTMTTDDFYRNIISQLGVHGNEAANMEESQSLLTGQVDGRRKSLSAVSLDEEMADMLKYQHSYTANSRVVNAIDEMIENIINRMGVVGR